MQYMLLIYDDEQAWQKLAEDERNNLYAAYGAFTNDVREKGILVAGEQLQPTAAATSVRIREGKELVTDGPFAETKEQLGGYYLIDVESVDEALEWAAKIPSARFGTIEVRPLVQMRVESQAG
jgi:hypothetical protein